MITHEVVNNLANYAAASLETDVIQQTYDSNGQETWQQHYDQQYQQNIVQQQQWQPEQQQVAQAEYQQQETMQQNGRFILSVKFLENIYFPHFYRINSKFDEVLLLIS